MESMLWPIHKLHTIVPIELTHNLWETVGVNYKIDCQFIDRSAIMIFPISEQSMLSVIV